MNLHQIQNWHCVAGSGAGLWWIDPKYGADTIDLHFAGGYHSTWRRDREKAAREFAARSAAGQRIPPRVLKGLAKR